MASASENFSLSPISGRHSRKVEDCEIGANNEDTQDSRQSQLSVQQVRDGGEGGANVGNERSDNEEYLSVEAEICYLFPDYKPANHVQMSTSSGSCLQYRFYDRPNEDHRRMQPRHMHEYQEKCRVLDKKTDFLVKHLGMSLKENLVLKRKLAEINEKNNMGEIKKGDDVDSSQNLLSNENGREKPLAIFPEEVWKVIFDLVEDPGDLENCYRSCVTFKTMLKCKKGYFLFPKVFKLVNSKYPFSTSDILNFRLVSKPWKKLADYFIETRPNRYNIHYLNAHEYNEYEEFRYTFDIDDPTMLRAYKKGLSHLDKIITELNSNFYKSQSSTTDWSPFPSCHIIIMDEDIPALRFGPNKSFPMGRYRHDTHTF